MKIGFIGAGNMATAIIEGLLASGETQANDIFVSRRNLQELVAFTEKYNINPYSTNEELVKGVDIVILAVKPNGIAGVLQPLQESLQKHKPVIVSIAAGVTLEVLEEYVGVEDLELIRVMPNVNAVVKESISALCHNIFTTVETKQKVLSIFSSIGVAMEVEEQYFQIFAAIGGSAPAYAYLFIDSLARGAVKNGMPKDLATKIAAQAVLGSAKMVLESDTNPWGLIDTVCSPGGTTVAGLMAMEDNGFISSVVKGVDATIAREKEIADKK